MALTKTVIAEKIQTELNLSRTAAYEVMEEFLEIIKETMENGEDIMISGFGKFCVNEKKARKGRNPATDEDMTLPGQTGGNVQMFRKIKGHDQFLISINYPHRIMVMVISEQLITGIILVTLMVDFIMNLVADRLNIGALTTHLPSKFADVYDTDRYTRSQKYLKVTTRFGNITAAVDLAVLLLFWFLGGFGALDSFVRGTDFSSIGCGLLFIGILAGCKFIISLPFSIYSTFVIEEKFGFNKTTPKLFILDLIKSISLSLILGGLLLSAIFWFLESTGPFAWIICWGVTTAFLLAVQYIVPTWIMPLFNKFTPLEDSELKEKLFAYARSIEFPLTQIFVMDGSKTQHQIQCLFYRLWKKTNGLFCLTP